MASILKSMIQRNNQCILEISLHVVFLSFYQHGRPTTVRVQDRVRLSTVDNFQGEEADIVIVSTVRCNKSRKIGFMISSNRVNVMMSRARHGLYVFGSAATIRSSPDGGISNYAY